MLSRALLAFALAFAVTPSFAASPSGEVALQASLQKLAARARPGTLGLMVTDADGKVLAHVNDDRAYMMMSSFKSPVVAAALAQVDAGTLSLERRVHLTPQDVVGGSGVPSIGDRLKHGPLDVSVRDLMEAAVTQSDNTAVDALLRIIGGAPVVTAWLEQKGIHGMRVDVDEHGLSRVFNDLKPGESVPANETAAQEDARRKRGYVQSLANPRNSTTLAAATTYLRKLQAGELLSATSTRRLLDMMKAQVVPNRIRAGLPAGFTIADKTGTGASHAGRISAYNDMAIITAPDGHHLQVAAFLRDSPASAPDRDAMYAQLGRILADFMQPH